MVTYYGPVFGPPFWVTKGIRRQTKTSLRWHPRTNTKVDFIIRKTTKIIRLYGGSSIIYRIQRSYLFRLRLNNNCILFCVNGNSYRIHCLVTKYISRQNFPRLERAALHMTSATESLYPFCGNMLLPHAGSVLRILCCPHGFGHVFAHCVCSGSYTFVRVFRFDPMNQLKVSAEMLCGLEGFLPNSPTAVHHSIDDLYRRVQVSVFNCFDVYVALVCGHSLFSLKVCRTHSCGRACPHKQNESNIAEKLGFPLRTLLERTASRLQLCCFRRKVMFFLQQHVMRRGAILQGRHCNTSRRMHRVPSTASRG